METTNNRSLYSLNDMKFVYFWINLQLYEQFCNTTLQLISLPFTNCSELN